MQLLPLPVVCSWALFATHIPEYLFITNQNRKEIRLDFKIDLETSRLFYWNGSHDVALSKKALYVFQTVLANNVRSTSKLRVLFNNL